MGAGAVTFGFPGVLTGTGGRSQGVGGGAGAAGAEVLVAAAAGVGIVRNASRHALSVAADATRSNAAPRPPAPTGGAAHSQSRKQPRMLEPMLVGTAIHHWLLTGLAAVTFILCLKSVVGPHLPEGAQRLILSI